MAQGSATFAGLRTVGGSFSMGNGAQPGQGIIVTNADSVAAPTGTLTLSYGGTNLVFPNCKTDRANYFEGLGGHRLMRHRIRDGRWQLAEAMVGGRFNRRGADGRVITQGNNRKNVRELFEELFGQLNINANLGSLPTDQYPLVEWDGQTGSVAIDLLCARTGFAFSLGNNGVYRVDAIGAGPDLPSPGSANNANRTFNFVTPSEIHVIGGPTLFQALFTMQAIGRGTGGNNFETLTNLSYRPAAGWGSESPEAFAGIPQPARYNAYETVYRYYEVTGWQDGPLTGVAELEPDDITTGLQILPIKETLASAVSSADDDTYYIGERAKIFGVWAKGNLVRENTTADQQYPGDFAIDGEEGRVRFTRPVYRLSVDQPADAELYLLTSYNGRHENGQIDRYTYKKTIAGGNGGVMRIRRDDLVRRVIQEYQFSGGSWRKDFLDDNLTDIKQEMTAHADRVAAQLAEAKDIEYDGFVNAWPSGVVNRVRFEWGRNEPARTRASKFMDFDFQNDGSDHASRTAEISDNVLRL